MQVHTENYSSQYGHNPKGLGCWFFLFGCRGAWTESQIYGSMNYGDAKKLAIRDAKAIGATKIIVCA